MISRRALHNLAYASFCILGLIALFVAVTFTFLSAESEDSLYAMLTFMTLVLGIPFAIVVLLGPGLTLVFWRDTNLMLLLMASVVAVMFLSSMSLVNWERVLYPYGALCVWYCARWTKRDRSSERQNADET